ncbi:hypothetical protein [Stenotrophomonas sp. SY1]|uniref:hypothetical protein n=1 Tax=Stenotrophomonas sp. SY1 TaxID=477235 RepID=UPI001E3B69D4|nr:hypothetical protein [Stenotrophomonas sp. SY1]MCD9087383.1 hypothetical protein [Stenotrophomonas sp. SY1]
MARMKMKAEPWADEGRDPLELIARLLVGGSYRVPVEGRSTIAPLSSADIAAAVAYMPDVLEKHAALTVATRADGVAIAQLALLAHARVAEVVAAARPRPLDLSLPADRWRLRLATFDAAHELVWPEHRQPWGVLAKAAKMRRATYCEVHRAATAVLQAALNDGRREFHGRLFAVGR